MKDRWKTGVRVLRGTLHELARVLETELVLADPTNTPDYLLYLKRKHLSLCKEALKPEYTDNGQKRAEVNMVDAKVRKVYKRYFYDL